MTTPSEDLALRRALRAGDESAFATVYDAHVQSVFNLAWRLTGNWSLAEDVTSETFLTAWRGRGSLLAEDRPLRPWILGIAAHHAMNATRGVRRRRAFLARHTEAGVMADFADEVAARVDDAETLARTRQALARLSRSEAEVVGLCVWSGLTYVEAAEALGVPVGTVRSRLSRARTRLRQLTEDPAPRPVPLTAPEGSR